MYRAVLLALVVASVRAQDPQNPVQIQVAQCSQLGPALAGATVSGISAQCNGAREAFGTFSGGFFGITSGVIVANGPVTQATSANPGATTELGVAGPSDDYGSLVLRFPTTTQGTISLVYVLATSAQELTSPFIDPVSISINGQPGMVQNQRPVTVSSLTASSWYYRANSNPPLYFGYAGYTTRLVAAGLTQASGGMNIVNVSVADGGPSPFGDTALFLDSNSLNVGAFAQAVPVAAPVPVAVPVPATVSYSWLPGPWGACPVSCGVSTQTRSVTCAGSDGSRVAIGVQGSLCNPAAVPAQAQQCNAGSCVASAPSFFYQISEWGACSVTCGSGGTRSRLVTCQGGTAAAAALTQCQAAGLTVPVRTELCSSRNACTLYNWETGVWGDCSVTCGAGTNSRSLTCRGSDGSVVTGAAAMNACPSREVPDSTGSCQLQLCPTNTWGVTSWGACSRTCGGGVSSRSVFCGSSANGRQMISDDSSCNGIISSIGAKPSATRACGTTQCEVEQYTYGVNEWGGCSVSCGTGVMTRAVYCGSPKIGTVAESACAAVSLTRPATSQPCTSGACEEYFYGYAAWGPCSSSCGTGVQLRSVYCQSTTSGGLRVSTGLCASLTNPLPSSQQICTGAACPSFQYGLGQWTPCSVSCGTGVQSRAVYCTSGNGLAGQVALTSCASAGATPATSQACVKASCAQYAYQANTWGKCSVSCGTGKQTRQVYCALSTSPTVPVANALCSGVPTAAPSTSQACNNGPCATYGYGTAVWTDCSVTCGTGGIQTRSVYCQSQAKQTVAMSYCTTQAVIEPKPPSSQPCSGPSCALYQYSFGGWAQCSASCGAGVQQRQVFCVSQTGGGVSDSFCAGVKAIKPTTQKQCLLVECVMYNWVTPEWSNCDVTCGSGVRTRDVYCQGSDGLRYGDEFCGTKNSAKPSTTKACMTNTACLSYGFAVSYWCTKDTSPCFEQTKQYDRTATCVDSTGNTVSREFCSGQEPTTKIECNLDQVIDDYIRQVCLSAMTAVPESLATIEAADLTWTPTQGLAQYMPLQPLTGDSERTTILMLTLQGEIVNFGQYQQKLLTDKIAERLVLTADRVRISSVKGGSITVFLTIRGPTEPQILSLISLLQQNPPDVVPLFLSFPLISVEMVTSIESATQTTQSTVSPQITPPTPAPTTVAPTTLASTSGAQGPVVASLVTPLLAAAFVWCVL